MLTPIVGLLGFYDPPFELVANDGNPILAAARAGVTGKGTARRR